MRDKNIHNAEKRLKLASGLGKHVKTKHSPALKCDEDAQAFAYDS